MPNISGPELAMHLRRTCPELKVLYISAYDPGELLLRPHLFEHGFGFIQKPFALEVLANWISGILRSTPKRTQATNSPPLIASKPAASKPQRDS
jgi:DNA-binding response OmpR family regulator